MVRPMYHMIESTSRHFDTSVLRMSFLPPPLLRSAQSCLRPSYRPCAHRALSYSLIVHSQKQSPAESAKSAPSEDVEEGEKEQEKEKEKEKEEEGSVDESSKITTYSEFLQKIAEPFKTASTPRNWLGQDTPFPMNESFKPPPPLSDAQREHMYKLYMLDPTANSVRALSERFHLSLKRVDAILRLKGMEHAWKKVRNVFFLAYTSVRV
ncbi:hypothetical protein D9758_000532 [Tetrapyrgos nigripes]|uniref:Uncharacterized protein n=1 Tax=Tetrapyrgos nigripes TaxID=182062 RepID=A0A8H5H1Z3_9AGAR|nr:hypothetical protein D9758_000532 [Tetrapyrgos nigripes]